MGIIVELVNKITCINPGARYKVVKHLVNIYVY
jgi:hypothetical protein